jgi:uncharacterized protein
MKSISSPLGASFADLKKMFSYNHDAPPENEAVCTEYINDICVSDIRYMGQSDERIKAYLIIPPGKTPFAGIIFVHPGPGGRSTFLDEALIHANSGAVSLLIDAPWANSSDFGRRASGPPEDVCAWFIEIAVDFSRAIDLISSLPNVDPNRIAYVGHSLGALFGGILSGVDKRIKTSVLMAGVGSFTDVAIMNMPTLTGANLEKYSLVMKPIDPACYVRHAAPCDLLFQFGLQDAFYPKHKFLEYYKAGSEPKSIQWYNADHYSLSEEGRSDRIEWLSSKLCLNPVI